MVNDEQIRADLLSILNIQMASVSVLASDCDDCPLEIPVVGEDQVSFLEKKIDEMDAALEPLTSFVIPGGAPVVSQAHIVRTVCRRTERCILRLSQDVNIQEDILCFYNRLSDYFFVLSRKLSQLSGLIQEPWKPEL